MSKENVETVRGALGLAAAFGGYMEPDDLSSTSAMRR
jgi:hypothetical protein